MDQPSRSGLKLIDVVVIVGVIGLLLMLFLPNEIHHREGARRTTCVINQKQLSLALLTYESIHHRFPGYANRIAKKPNREWLVGSWVAPLLPHLERKDLHDCWKKGDPQSPRMSYLICPSDRARSADKPELSYVANCGLPGDKDSPAEGVFHNHDVDGTPVTTSLDYLATHDGASNTLLLSENLQAGYWTDTEEANVGMVWFREPEECSKINRGIQVGPRPQDIRYARPSARHNGVFVASFCDGHQNTLSTDIDYSVYQHLMTPDSKAAGLKGKLEEQF